MYKDRINLINLPDSGGRSPDTASIKWEAYFVESVGDWHNTEIIAYWDEFSLKLDEFSDKKNAFVFSIGTGGKNSRLYSGKALVTVADFPKQVRQGIKIYK